ncbi:Hsp33 family molecular chaperone HslO [Alkaliphilus hydrothermalis]|uniref:33 kDa chaperonin n=1 Tax=Alkaliphilus hydrothermalis TaxID=1482730 RepID=A0ABS2NSI1_9FIRM|nr:Hsp33 family molecular chaperone HslO [Alkaliphilus hydrothermalis]MBM7615920.1 molecular chaperone Hsp33 [Alkaliphilus hydrothermalis]
MKNKVLRITAANNTIRGFFADTTQMVEKAKVTHVTSPVAIAALGRTLTATSIMGLMLKEDHHKITVKINGGGPLGTILAVGNARGNVKGYVGNPQVESTNIREGKLNVGAAVGTNGSITVIRDLGLRDPYVGSYQLTTGEIAEDFTAYFLHSEQQPSAVALGVLVDTDYTIKAAGGFIIQVMPDITEEVLVKLEAKLQQIESITDLMKKGKTEADILQYVLGEFEPKVLEEYEVDFVCDCHEERLEKALISIGSKDLQEIIEEDGGAEMVCHFCNKKYYFDKDHLTRLLETI